MEPPHRDLAATSRVTLAPKPDTAVAGTFAWRVRAAMFAAAFAVIATSTDAEYTYEFVHRPEVPLIELTGEAPERTVRLRVRVDAMGPDGVDSTQSALAKFTGTIDVSGLDAGNRPFVQIQAGTDGPSSVLTTFDRSVPLEFSGDCTLADASAPCSTELPIRFARDDAGARGGSVRVAWQMKLEAIIAKSDEPDRGPMEPPWTVEVLSE